MRRTALNEVGDENAPVGSPAWCQYVRLHVQAVIDDETRVGRELKRWLSALQKHQGWSNLTDRRGRKFSSWEEFCRYPRPWGLGQKAESLDVEAQRRVLLTHAEAGAKGGRGKKAVGSNNSFHGNPDKSYTLARLDRDAPELAAKVRAGDLSANAAAIQAGFRIKTISIPLNVERAAAALKRFFPTSELQALKALL